LIRFSEFKKSIQSQISLIKLNRCAHFIPVAVGATNGFLTALYLLQTGTEHELVSYIAIDWVIFLLRLLSVAEPEKTDVEGIFLDVFAEPISRTAKVPEKKSERRRGVFVDALFRLKPLRLMHSWMRWGRLSPPGEMNQQAFHGWVMIIESTMQTSVFIALLLAYGLTQHTVLGVGDGGLLQRMIFPHKEVSLYFLLIATVSDAIQDFVGHYAITVGLRCHYSRHFAGSWLGLFRISAIALAFCLMIFCYFLAIGRIAEDAKM